ncbi:MAG: homocysteine S-methyltransferase family protein [Chloroflexota bacterium]
MKITLLDGGMGQELVARWDGKPTGLWSAQVMMEAPEHVAAVHRDYFAAGAEIATTNSYAIQRERLVKFGIEDKYEALHQKACQIAVAARDEHGSGQVAGSLGPLGWSYRPDLAPPVEKAAVLYAEMARLQAPYVDMLLLETMSSVAEARGGVMGAATVGKSVWLAISVDDDDGTKLRSGESVTDVLPLVKEFGVETLLINCSIPEAVSQAIPLLVGHGVPVGGYANGFNKISKDFLAAGSSVDVLEQREDLGPAIYADFVDDWVAAGATIVGGCCEVGPAHIRELTGRLREIA